MCHTTDRRDKTMQWNTTRVMKPRRRPPALLWHTAFFFPPLETRVTNARVKPLERRTIDARDCTHRLHAIDRLRAISILATVKQITEWSGVFACARNKPPRFFLTIIRTFAEISGRHNLAGHSLTHMCVALCRRPRGNEGGDATDGEQRRGSF